MAFPAHYESEETRHVEVLHGKMAAVSVMCMRTGSYAHIIALINFWYPVTLIF